MPRLRTLKRKVAEVGLEMRLIGVELGILGNGSREEYLRNLLNGNKLDDYSSSLARERLREEKMNGALWSAKPTLIEATKIRAMEMGLQGYSFISKGKRAVEYIEDILLEHGRKRDLENGVKWWGLKKAIEETQRIYGGFPQDEEKKIEYAKELLDKKELRDYFVKAACGIVGRFYEKEGEQISRKAFSHYQLADIMYVYYHVFSKPKSDKELLNLAQDRMIDIYNRGRFYRLYIDSTSIPSPTIDETTRISTAKGVAAFEISSDLISKAEHYYRMGGGGGKGGRLNNRNWDRVHKFKRDYIEENLYELRTLLPYLDKKLGGNTDLDKIKEEVIQELRVKTKM